MNVSLAEIPGVMNQHQTCWVVRVLCVEGRDLVLGPLAEWEKDSPGDYKKS